MGILSGAGGVRPSGAGGGSGFVVVLGAGLAVPGVVAVAVALVVGLVAAEPEHVLFGGADKGAGAGGIEVGDEVREPADDRAGQRGGLALDEVGRGRQLVRDGGHSDVERPADRV